MKKFLSLFLALLLPLLFFSSCRSNESFYITYPVYENIRTLDPQYTSSLTAKLIDVNIFEGLVAPGENGELVPAAAKNWEKNGLTYTFHLREDAKWNLSGAAKEGLTDKLEPEFAPYVTADDFVFAFTRLADPNTGAPDAYRFASIQNFPQALSGEVSPSQIGVRAESDFVLTITLSREDPDFLKKLLLPCAMPCNRAFFEICGGRYGLMTRYLLTNGPFYFSRWNVDQSFRISKSTTYTGNRVPHADGVWFYLNEDSAEMNRKLAEGVYTAGFSSLASFDESILDKNYQVHSVNNGLLSLIFHCGGPVTSVKSVRTALTASLNPDLFKSEKAASGLLPPNISLPEGVNNTFSIGSGESDAKASLKAALLELSANDISLKVLCPSNYETLMKNQMQEWQKMLGVSLNVTIQAMSENDLLTAVSEGDFDAALYPLRAPSDFPEDFLALFTSGHAGNAARLSSNEYDELYKAVCNSTDEKTRGDAINKALQYLNDNSVYVPLFENRMYFAADSEVTDLYDADFFDFVYFDRAKRK